MTAATAHHNVKKGIGRVHPPLFVSLAAWYRNKTGITNISGKCSSWADASNNSRPLLQGTAANRPTVNSSGALVFTNAASNTMSATFTLAQPFTVYIAFSAQSWTSGRFIFDGKTAATQLTQTGSTPGLAFNAGSALATSTTLALNQNGVVCCVANGASSVYQVGGGASAVTTTGNAGANAAGGFTLGSSRTPANSSNITVYEVLIYSVAHGAQDRLNTLRYLSRIASVGGV